MFQSTHPYRVWPLFNGTILYPQWFQSTHPYRVWQTPCSIFASIHQFQSTHPYRVWLWYFQDLQFLEGFNPHTHTGCDYTYLTRYFPRCVSIHTPIQGVTMQPAESLAVLPVSIHTPIQGVTDELSLKILLRKFQSTHPYRVWLNARMFTRTMPMFQSTHPYRVWHIEENERVHLALFQSTHPYRVWQEMPERDGSMSRFNPHTHTGCDFLLVIFIMVSSCFNPHTHTGCDCYEPFQIVGLSVSIHTPIQGVTCVLLV